MQPPSLLIDGDRHGATRRDATLRDVTRRIKLVNRRCELIVARTENPLHSYERAAAQSAGTGKKKRKEGGEKESEAARGRRKAKRERRWRTSRKTLANNAATRNARFAAHNYERARARRGGEGASGRGRKAGYRNYCGSETCATAVYLNEDRENADGKGRGRKERERGGGKKRERPNYRFARKGNGQIIISGPAESPNN